MDRRNRIAIFANIEREERSLPVSRVSGSPVPMFGHKTLSQWNRVGITIGFAFSNQPYNEI